jgi:hypothetical protein
VPQYASRRQMGYSTHGHTMVRMSQLRCKFWQIEYSGSEAESRRGALGPHLPKGATSKREWSSNGANPIQAPQTLRAPQQSKHQPSSPIESRQLSLQDRTCINPTIRHIVSACDATFDVVSPITPQHQPDQPVNCTSGQQQWLPKLRQRSAPPPG